MSEGTTVERGAGRAPEPRAARESDACLKPYLEAATEPEVRRHLTRLMEEAEPVIRGILRRRWGVSGDTGGARQSREGQIAEDVRGEVTVSLLTRLHQLRANPGTGAIGDFRSFVAVMTYHVCDNHLRRKYPQRASLKNKLTYLLTQRSGQTGLAAWDGADGARLGGFAQWRDGRRPLTRNQRYTELVTTPQAFVNAALARESIAHLNPADLLAAMFNWVGGPIEMDDLVNVVAQLWGVRDQAADEGVSSGREDEDTDVYAQVADPRANVATEVAQRAYLRQLWDEIRQLPPRQCAALLLNLKDAQGRGVIALFPLERIATMREIAAALGMPAERFAALWNDLPIEDLAIAELLGVTRQQVINLRKVARERLARRMRAFTETM